MSLMSYRCHTVWNVYFPRPSRQLQLETLRRGVPHTGNSVLHVQHRTPEVDIATVLVGGLSVKSTEQWKLRFSRWGRRWVMLCVVWRSVVVGWSKNSISKEAAAFKTRVRTITWGLIVFITYQNLYLADPRPWIEQLDTVPTQQIHTDV